jgi:hypothetical protein
MQHIVRSDLSDPIYSAIKHLSVDLGQPVNALIIEGLVLLLRYHSRGDGLPEPIPPFPRTSASKKGGAK